jgi:aryl-alcohol dehydrogenase-like predicted oxidoreductase
MEKVILGRTGIKVSKLGIGTGTAHTSGRCSQAMMKRKELAGLLVYAFKRGITFWDTAVTYETHLHIREALRSVKRSEVVISTKINTSKEKDTSRDFHKSLSELDVDHIDICLVHGVRTEGDLNKRQGALDTLLEFKRQGKIRAVGISSHGLSALKAVIRIPEIDLVLARINYAGRCMDSCTLDLYNQLASISWVKKAVKKIVPRKLISAMRPNHETDLIQEDEQKEVRAILEEIHSQQKGIVGMKVLAEGQLRENVQKAIGYVNTLPYVNSFIIGMMTKDEINENCGIVNK